MKLSIGNALLCHVKAWNGRILTWAIYVCGGAYVEKGEEIGGKNANFDQCL